MKAISIKQPWASLIAHGIKDVENRTWKCPEKYIGQRVLIHASASKKEGYMLKGPMEVALLKSKSVLVDTNFNELPFGAIIGSVKIVGCTVNYLSVWAEKSKGIAQGGHVIDEKEPIIYNWILAEPILFDASIPAKGKLSFWEADVEEMKIECPECGCVQMAVVDHTTVPFSSYVHECQNCAYLITESDWNEVKE